MWRDSIVKEVRQAYAKRFNYDIQAIYRDLKEQEAKSCREDGRPPAAAHGVYRGVLRGAAVRAAGLRPGSGSGPG